MKFLKHSLFFIALCCVIWASSSLDVASASTFIGNGADAADSALRIDKADLHSTLKSITKENAHLLCSCSASNPYLLCKQLDSLNTEKRHFCRQQILASQSDLFRLTDDSSKISLEFRKGPLNVKTKSGNKRVADAVTNPQKSTIIIDRDRYLELGSGARLALLAHEFFHLLPMRIDTYSSSKTENHKMFWQDEDPVGPFPGAFGARDALDVFGAALAVFHWEISLDLSRDSVKYISKGWRNNDLSFGLYSSIGISDAAKEGYKKLLLTPDSLITSIGYQRHYGDFGAEISYSLSKETNSTISFLDPLLETQAISLLLLWKFFPFSPVSFYLSQLHLKFGIGARYLFSEWSLSDSETHLRSKEQGQAAKFSCDVSFPLLYDFWIYTGAFGDYLWLKHPEQKADLSGFSYGLNGGIRYGF